MAILLAGVMGLTIVRYVVVIRRAHTWWPLLELAIVMLAGLVAGVLLGVTARVAMRSLAVYSGEALRFTPGGTLNVIVVFAGLGAVIALPYAGLFRQSLGHRGLTYGALLTALTWYPFARTAFEDSGATTWSTHLVAASVAMAALMWLPYGVLLAAVSARLWHRLMRAYATAED